MEVAKGNSWQPEIRKLDKQERCAGARQQGKRTPEAVLSSFFLRAVKIILGLLFSVTQFLHLVKS